MKRPWFGQFNPVLQAEASECGLASLTMVARAHGHDVDLSGLRRLYPTSMKGATLEELMVIAADLELAPRAVRLDLDELKLLRLPAILHWDLNHFVVLESVDPNRHAVVLDPARGRRIVPWAKLDRHFTGVALELEPTTQFRPISARVRPRLSDLWSRLVRFRSAAGQVLLLSLALQLSALLAPLYIQTVVDEALPSGDDSLLSLLLIGFGLVYLLQAVVRSLREWVIVALGQSLSFDLAGNVVRHLMRLPLGFFERRHIGDLMSRVGSIQPIQSLLTHGLVDALIDATLVLATLAVMLMISPLLAGIVVASTLVYLAISQSLYPALRRRSEEEIVARARESSYLMETIRAIRSVKLHGHEAARESGWRNRYVEVISASYRTRLFEIKVDLAENLLFGGAFLLCVYLGALAVLDKQLTVGVLLAFLSYRASFAASATALVKQFASWRLLSLHLDRLSDIVHEQRESFTPHVRRQVLAGPAIRFDDVTFAYSPGERPILANVDLEIAPGSFVAITGPSGAGKTTLLRVMLGLLPPTEGRVLVDGTPLGPGNMAAWRGRIGAVLQDDHLLTGTLADNISFFDGYADDARVQRVAELAQIHEDIARMPMGYQSLIGDMGSALSSGQRQRIMIARALYRDPDVLFLDEGTANLDGATEEAIAELVAALPITRVVIAHRPALIQRAQRVIEVRSGSIQERQAGQGACAAASLTIKR